jgi:hypothetical protein
VEYWADPSLKIIGPPSIAMKNLSGK